MRAPMIVKGQIASDRAARRADAIVGSQADLLVFDASPQALDENVVSPDASAVHADRDAMLQQHAGKVDTPRKAVDKYGRVFVNFSGGFIPLYPGGFVEIVRCAEAHADASRGQG
jgi:hypothetical protein